MILITFLLNSFNRRTYRTHSQTAGQRPSIEDTEQPPTPSLSLSRSPFFEMFRQYPPPPTYEDTLKQARINPTAPEISVIQVNEEDPPINPPPLEANSPPPYSLECENSSVSNNSIMR